MWIIKTGYRMPMVLGVAWSLCRCSAGDWPTEANRTFTIDGFWSAGILAIGGLGIGLSAPASDNAALDLAPSGPPP